MTIEEMKVKRKELGLSCRELAELGDLPLATVQKVFSGATKAPRSKTIQSLENVFGKFTEKEVIKELNDYSKTMKKTELYGLFSELIGEIIRQLPLIVGGLVVAAMIGVLVWRIIDRRRYV